MCVNHPETIPWPQSMKKLSSTKLAPGAKNVGDCCHEEPLDSDIRCFKV